MAYSDVSSHSVKVANYKCFGETPQGFDSLRPLNVLIGRNNSGKSALLDVIQHLENRQPLADHPHGKRAPILHLGSPLTEANLARVFPSKSRGGAIPGENHWEYGRKWIGKPYFWTVDVVTGAEEVLGPRPPFSFTRGQDYARSLSEGKQLPLSGRPTRRLAAERNVRPESESGTLRLAADGAGATNAIQAFVNDRTLPSEVVEEQMLSDLNAIFRPDTEFERIVVQKDTQENTWEVSLFETGKGRVALSHTGSGLKTVLLVICFLRLLPRIEKRDVGDYVFLFEELENNLHPALERRLLSFLRGTAERSGCVFFLTTHSPVSIDFFAKDRHAQILHVVHDGSAATVSTATTYVQNRGVVDDLDVRASDLLQANAILWVEGPSDRLYLNRWLALLTDGDLVEGRDYQCMFYGGRLLAHLSATAPRIAPPDLIALLAINRNAAVVMDSDRSSELAALGANKTRITRELEQVGLLPWITDGREIENYLSAQTISAALGRDVARPPTKAQRFIRFLEGIESGAGERFAKNKVLFAERAADAMTPNDLDRLDLRDKLEELRKAIDRWNGRSETT